MKNLTIKDIAKMAGVSPTTVSFVLNDKGGVSPQKREKIKLIIEQTGFAPNVHTRRLNLKRSFNINLAIKQNASAIGNMFYIEILLGILEESRHFPYNIVLSDISDLEREKRLIYSINNRDCDGVIFLQDPTPTMTANVTGAGLPFIVVDTQMRNPPFTTISVDYCNAARVSVEHLISKGHRSIAYIGMESHPGFHKNTFNGYKTAMEAAGLTIAPNWIQSGAYDEATSYACMEHILDGGEPPSAVFCSSDILAYSSMLCALERGYAVPDDISFIGMDDIRISKYTQPALSTLTIDSNFMGKAAMRLIDNMINNGSRESIVLSSNTIAERASVKDLRSP